MLLLSFGLILGENREPPPPAPLGVNSETADNRVRSSNCSKEGRKLACRERVRLGLCVPQAVLFPMIRPNKFDNIQKLLCFFESERGQYPKSQHSSLHRLPGEQ